MMWVLERTAKQASQRGKAAPDLVTALDPEGDQRFPFVVDTTGVPDAVTEAIRRAEIGATIVELGLDARPFTLDATTLVRQQLVLRGSLTYDHPQDFRWSTALVSEGSVRLGRVVSHEFPLAEAQSAFDACATAPGKTWIRLAASA